MTSSSSADSPTETDGFLDAALIEYFSGNMTMGEMQDILDRHFLTDRITAREYYDLTWRIGRCRW